MAQIAYALNPLAPLANQPVPALGPLTGKCLAAHSVLETHQFVFQLAIPAHLAHTSSEGLYRCGRCQLSVKSAKWPSKYQPVSLQTGCPVNSTRFHTWHRHAWDWNAITCSGCRRVHAKCAHTRFLPQDDTGRCWWCLDCHHVVYDSLEIALTQERFWP